MASSKPLKEALGGKVEMMPDIPYVEDVTRFWLPVAPTGNNLYTNVALHGRRKAPGYRQWLHDAGWRIKEQRVQPIPGKRWALRIEAPVNHRRDLSNCLKAAEDLIVEMRLISDDRYIDHIVLDRVSSSVSIWSTLNGKREMRVSIWALS